MKTAYSAPRYGLFGVPARGVCANEKENNQMTIVEMPPVTASTFEEVPFARNPFTRSLAALAGISPQAQEILRRVGRDFPSLPDVVFEKLVIDLQGPGIESEQLRGLVPFEDVFRPLVIAVVSRLLRGAMNENDFDEIARTAARLESLDIPPAIQFATYANLHRHCSDFLRRELPVDEGAIAIDAMAGFWMLTSAFFTESYIAARQKRELALVEETARLARESGLDPLTRLMNRSVLNRFARTVDPSETVALLFIDLDGFKSVNDRFGHLAGDALLCQVAARIQSTVREPDLAIRFGGDEFLVVLRGANAADVSAIAGRLSKSLHQRYEIDGAIVRISASIGLTQLECGEPLHEGVAHADSAAYEAKRAGGGEVVAYRRSA
jgi:diguanylate cyclase (GGDEF)-like protein